MSTQNQNKQLPQLNTSDISVNENLGKIVEQLNELIKGINELVKASETELVDLKYDSGVSTLTWAVSADPGDSNVTTNTGYVRERIYEILERKSPELYLINLGPGTIYARMSKDGKSFTNQESMLFEGEVKVFYDVYELRIRSPTINTQYIASEFEHTKNKDISFLSGRPYVSETSVAVAGTPNTELIVTDPVKGLGRNAHTGYIINDGPGNLLITLSNNGTTFTPTITVIPNQILDLEKEDVYTIIIDASANATAYRLSAH